MNRNNFEGLVGSPSDFSKSLNEARSVICSSCGNEVGSDDIIEARGNVGCIICLR